jgi:hypothetical protein
MLLGSKLRLILLRFNSMKMTLTHTRDAGQEKKPGFPGRNAGLLTTAYTPD